MVTARGLGNLVFGSLFFCIFVCLGGCGQKVAEKIAEKTIETAASRQGEKIDVDMSTGQMTVKTDQGTAHYDFEKGTMSMQSESGEASLSFGEGAKLPPDFPKDVPVYENQKLNMVMHDDTEKTITFTASSPDDAGKISAFYKENMAKQGWTEESSMAQDMGKMTLMTFTKGEREATVMVISAESGSEITVTAKQ